MKFDLQPTLQDENVILAPLQQSDFERLYKVAADPLIWEQHPNKNRYQLEDFTNYFKGAIESKGAFIIFDTKTGEVIGSSRFYELDETNSSISIGYTFFNRAHWGGPYNKSAKSLMMNHAFKYIDKLIFHIGAINVRSQVSIQRLGAKKVGEQEIEYYGEGPKWNYIYEICKEDWANQIR